jgi:hypothetical protein
VSGYSGFSGYSGISGYSSFSGFSGYSGYSSFSGFSGFSGYSGLSGTAGSAAGSPTYVQYNSGGSFAGSSGFTYNATTQTASVTNLLEGGYSIVSQKDVGTNANQIPLNQYLGKLAFQDYVGTAEQNILIDTNTTAVQPTLLLDFANAKTLDSRITFTRSTTAVAYDGKTSVLAEQNLALQSQTFATGSWSTSNIAFTANSTTAPDGTSTATTITASGAGSLPHYSQSLVTTSAGIATDSIYVKTNTAQYVQIFFGGDATSYANFDVVNGTVTASSGTATGSIVSVGSGWYRCIASNTSTAVTGFGIAIIPASGSGRIAAFSAAGTESLYIWGAQLEQRSSATAYNATTTTALTNYIPTLQTYAINVPRLDYDPVTRSPLGLLIEQSSTNLLTYSQDFTNAAWNKARCSVTPTANTAPDGTQTMQLLVEDATTNSHPVYRTVTGLVSGTPYTETIYVKPYGRTQVNITLSNTAFPVTPYITFDINSGVIVTTLNGATGTITSVGNGVYKCTLTATAGASGNGDVYIQPCLNGATNYTGNGYSGIYIWGAQLEALSFPTSYIATTSAQVTRGADVAQMIGTNFSSWYNFGQGSWYSEFNVNQVTQIWSLLWNQNGNGRIVYGITGTMNSYDGTNIGTFLSGVTAGVYYKVATALTQTLNTNVAQGNIPTTSTTNGNLLNSTNIYIGNQNGTGVFLNGHIKKIAYYPTALSSAELQEITS